LITLDHIRNLSATELRIASYMSLGNKELEMTQMELAETLQVSDRQLRQALESLEERRLISYIRGEGYTKGTKASKGKITWN